VILKSRVEFEKVYKLGLVFKKMKKAGWFFGLLILLGMPLVSASSHLSGSVRDILRESLQVVIAFLTPFLEVIIGDYSTGEFFFAKVLLLILLFVFIRFILGRVPAFENQGAVSATIALIVSIFAVRFISESGVIFGILLPFGTLGIAIATALPFIIYFYFIHTVLDAGYVGRRILWVLFGVVFVLLWINRADAISDIGNQIYGLMTFLIVLSILLDRQIHKYFTGKEMQGFFSEANLRSITKLQEEYLRFLNVDTPHARKLRQDIKRRLKAMGGELP